MNTESFLSLSLGLSDKVFEMLQARGSPEGPQSLHRAAAAMLRYDWESGITHIHRTSGLLLPRPDIWLTATNSNAALAQVPVV